MPPKLKATVGIVTKPANPAFKRDVAKARRPLIQTLG